MRHVTLLAFIAGGLLATGQASFAQTPPPAPTAEASAKTLYPYVGVYGFPPALKPGGTFVSQSLEPTLLRRAAPDGDLRDWLSESDPAIALLKDGKTNGGVALEIQIDARGRATDCKVQHQYGDTALTEGLCERILPRVRMKPAIDSVGAPAADAFVYSAFFGQSYQPRERLVEMQLPSPAPMPNDQWPPWSTATPVVVTKLDLLEGGPASPDAAGSPWAGMVLDAGQVRTCRVIASSGDAAFNQRACDVAKKGRYDVSKATSVFQQRIYLLFVLQKGKPRALIPASERFQRPAAAPDSVAAIQQALSALPAGAMAKLRLHVSIDKAGAVTGCMILDSTGTDAGDVLACNAVRRLGRFTPARDVFGRPVDGALYDWSLASKAG